MTNMTFAALTTHLKVANLQPSIAGHSRIAV